jgi:hypothetical protein
MSTCPPPKPAEKKFKQTNDRRKRSTTESASLVVHALHEM